MLLSYYYEKIAKHKIGHTNHIKDKLKHLGGII